MKLNKEHYLKTDVSLETNPNILNIHPTNISMKTIHIWTNH